MSKKLRRAAKALAGIGAAYLGSKMLGKGRMEDINMQAVYEDMPSPKTQSDIGTSVMPKAKPKMDKPAMTNLERRQSFRSRRGAGASSGLTGNQRRDAMLSDFNKKADEYNKAVIEARKDRAFRANVQNFSKGSGKKGVTAKCKLGRNKPTKLY